MQMPRYFALIAAVVAIAACDNKGSSGGGGTAGNHEPPPPPPPTVAITSGGAAAPGQEAIEISIASVGNEMKFDKTELSAPAGAFVRLTLKNNATMATMPHNWVLVKTGTEAKVALDGFTRAADAGYVVPGPDVLAASPLALPGATVAFTFTAPPPGKYPYVCTFPGHYLSMKGTLTTVTP